MKAKTRTFVKELSQPAVLLQRADQRGRLAAANERRLERRTEAGDLQHVRVLLEPLVDGPLMVVRAVRLLAALLRHLRLEHEWCMDLAIVLAVSET